VYQSFQAFFEDRDIFARPIDTKRPIARKNPSAELGKDPAKDVFLPARFLALVATIATTVFDAVYVKTLWSPPLRIFQTRG
jgi:hypothetical protein